MEVNEEQIEKIAAIDAASRGADAPRRVVLLAWDGGWRASVGVVRAVGSGAISDTLVDVERMTDPCASPGEAFEALKGRITGGAVAALARDEANAAVSRKRAEDVAVAAEADDRAPSP